MTTAVMEVSSKQLYDMVGAQAPTDMYTPVSVGKMGKVRYAGKSFMTSLKTLNYTDTMGLKAQSPENVYKAIPSFVDQQGNVQVMEKFRAIIGEETNKPYSVMSNLYNPVQHGEVLKTIADVLDAEGIQVCGSVNVYGGKMFAHAFLMGQQYFFDLLQDIKDGSNKSIIGIRAFNSHTGKTGFGMEFFAIRMICSNGMSMGKTLGSVYWTHKEDEAKMMSGYRSVLHNMVNAIPNVQRKMSDMASEELYVDEATALLYGIGLQEANVEGIMMNLKGLNPEIKDFNRPTKFEIYNSATAYVSHKVTGGLESHILYSDAIEKMVGAKTSPLIEKGFEKMKVIEARNKARTIKLTAMPTIISE